MKKTLISLAVASIVTSSLFADAETDALKAQLKAMTERLDAMETKQETLVEETTNLQTGFTYNVVDVDYSHNGMGAAASKVYKSKSPLSIGGYGEMNYQNKEDADNVADVYRFVPYIGYRFTDNIILNTEIEFEHGGAKPGAEDPQAGGDYGYAVIEFMYLDFLFNDNFNLQAGLLLAPMGIINLRHEPTLFNTVQRPNTEKYLIPSTWNSNGVIAYGKIGESFTYNAGIMQALNFDNENAGSQKQIRGSRLGSGKSAYNNLAGVARLDYVGTPGLMVGASGYYGSATQGSVSGATAFMYDLHATYENSGFKLKALYTATEIDNADKIVTDGNYIPAGEGSVESANGYYVNAEYDILHSANSEYKLPIFVQYDYINPTDKVVDGSNNSIDGDANAEIATTTIGVNFFPHPQVVIKADYAMARYKDSGATKNDNDTFSLGLGFIF